jgi:hypothetical protein
MLFSEDDDFKKFLRNLCQKNVRHDCYAECCEHAEEMAVHLYGKKPFKLLDLSRPREDIETKDYRLGVYQPTTKATAGKAISILSRMFNPSLYSIKWTDQSEDAKMLENYTLNEYPEFNSVVNFMADSALKKILADPNGVFAVRPIKFEISQSTRPQATAKIFGSPNIWFFDVDIYLIFIRSEKIKSTIPPQVITETFFFEYYDEQNIIEFSVSFPNINTTELVVQNIYPHGCGEIPVWKLGGVPEIMDNGAIMYRSWLDDALPFWNYAVIHESDLVGAFINHLHPIRTELAEECDYIMNNHRCISGMIRTVDEQGIANGNMTCPSCHGTGHRSVKSPYGVYLFSKEKLEGNTSGLSPVEYVNVPTDATKMLDERVDKMHEKGLNAVNMDIANKVGENQSGVAKVIDRSELYDTIGKIAASVFDVHLKKIYRYFNFLMFKVSTEAKPNDPFTPDKLISNLPDINRPTTFDMDSAQELLDRITASRNAQVNPEVSKSLQKDLIGKEFANSIEEIRRLTLVLDLDPLGQFNMTDLVAGQTILPKPWPGEWTTIHLNMGHFIDRALQENKTFADLDKDQQLAILEGYAKEVMTRTKVTLNPAIQQFDAQGNPIKVDAQGNPIPINVA